MALLLSRPSSRLVLEHLRSNDFVDLWKDDPREASINEAAVAYLDEQEEQANPAPLVETEPGPEEKTDVTNRPHLKPTAGRTPKRKRAPSSSAAEETTNANGFSSDSDVTDPPTKRRRRFRNLMSRATFASPVRDTRSGDSSEGDSSGSEDESPVRITTKKAAITIPTNKASTTSAPKKPSVVISSKRSAARKKTKKQKVKQSKSSRKTQKSKKKKPKTLIPVPDDAPTGAPAGTEGIPEDCLRTDGHFQLDTPISLGCQLPVDGARTEWEYVPWVPKDQSFKVEDFDWSDWTHVKKVNKWRQQQIRRRLESQGYSYDGRKHRGAQSQLQAQDES